MWGISYGGFTAIQVAALRPPHLRAIVPVMATDDRYLDDVHYRGGCVTVSELSQYAVSQVAMNAMPPDAAFRGAAWRDEWLARLDATPPWLFAWLRQQADGPYWRQGSLAPDYDAIEAAIFNIGGWQDSYVDPAFRMQARCPAPSHTLVGQLGAFVAARRRAGPQPRRTARDRPILRSTPARGGQRLGHRAADRLVRARVRAAGAVPSDDAGPLARGDGVTRTRRRSSGPCSSGRERSRWPGGSSSRAWTTASRVDTFTHRPTAGTRGPLSWGAGDAPNGLARDLRRDEDAGPTYTSDPLDGPLEILGVPEVVVHVEVDAPVATLSVRLSDVAPDGSVALVSAGVLNLTHRRSHSDPEPLRPGVVEEVRVPLRTAGYRWLPGHRIRVALASSLWPVAVAVAISGHVPGPSRARHAVAPRAPGRSRPPAVRATRPCRRSGPSHRTCTGRSRSRWTAGARP